jgi:hypothetical protein
MKKIVALLLLSGFITSCGPKRLGCGPGRCEVENPTLKTKPLKNIC